MRRKTLDGNGVNHSVCGCLWLFRVIGGCWWLLVVVCGLGCGLACDPCFQGAYSHPTIPFLLAHGNKYL